MAIRANDEALASDGAGLVSSATPCTPGSPCQPPAHDATSVAMAALLNHHDATVSALLDHAALHRAAGGVAVAGSGRMLADADHGNAVAISAITGDGAPGPTTASMAPTDVPMIAAPVLPSAPGLPTAPPPMTGEEIAQHVHGGPGAESVRNLANHWRSSVAPAVSKTADNTYNYAASIDEHWQDDGTQRAGSNTVEHAQWLSAPMREHIIALADHADEYASHVDELRNATPTPEEFTELHTKVNNALATYRQSGGLNSAPLVAATSKLAEKQGQAIDAYTTYAAATTTTVGSAPTPPPPAPAIVRGGQMHVLQPPKSPGEPKDSKDDKEASSAGKEHGKGPGGENPLSDVPGQALTTDNPAPPGTPTGVPAASVADTTAPGAAANVAGTIVGAITGAASQLAGGLPGAGGGSMLPSALSELSSALPSMGGMPQSGMPSMPSDMGSGGDSGWSPSSGDSGLDDFGSGGTTPASSGGGGGGGGAPVSGAGPAIGQSGPVAAVPAAPISAPAPTGAPGGPTGGAMGGMMPPMMGGLGRDGAEERDKNKDRRVVLRPAPNSEPIFGAVERKRSARRTSPASTEKGNSDSNN